jgi:3D (Asp-Asp-Asp) domain-containing protein
LRIAAAMVLAALFVIPVHAEHRKAGRALLTFYWLIDESSARYEGKRDTPLLDARGRLIARTHARFRRDLVMEGGGRLLDGRTVVFHKRVKGEHRFRISRTKYGIGSRGCALEPYRTVAVDPFFVKLGSTVYIPQLKGAVLPDGTIHDGMFIANDRGHFRGAHVDVFVGAGARGSRPFARKGYGSRSHVTVYVTDEKTREPCH